MDILEFIKKMQEMYGEDVITTANKIKRPDPKPIVKEIEAINEFVRRNPKADGGQLLAQPSADGSRQGYATSTVKTKKFKYSKNYYNNKTKKVETVYMDKPPKTSAQEIGSGKFSLAERNRVTRIKYPKYTSYLELLKKEPAKAKNVMANLQYSSVSGSKIKKKTHLTRLTKIQENKILAEFPDAVFFDGQKFGFNTKTDQTKFVQVKTFIDRGYKPKFKQLPDKIQNELKEKFSEFKDWDFKKFKYGVPDSATNIDNRRLMMKVKTFINDPKPWKLGFSTQAKGGWMVQQMYRAWEHGNTDYEPKYNKNNKVIGMYEKGKLYYANENVAEIDGAKKFKLINSHPEFNKIQKFVDVADEAKLPLKKLGGYTNTKALLALFPEGYENIKFSDLTNYLYKEAGADVTRNAIERHHLKALSDMGAPINPKNLQLLRQDLNTLGNTIAAQIKKGDFSRVGDLEKAGVKITIGDKTYGKGFQDPKRQLNVLIGETTKKIQSLSEKKLTKLFKDLCPKGKASGGRIGYQDAGAVGKTLQCGINQFNKNMKTGNANSALMRRILANGGNILTSVGKQLNPAELLKLRNLIGPQALGFLAAYEAGVITDDVLRKNTPLNEALAKNWLTKSFLPYNEQAAKAKNLLQSGKLETDAQKVYALDLMKYDQAIKKQEKLEQMKFDQGLGYGKDESGITNEMIDSAEKDLNRRIEDLSSRSVFTEGSAIGQEYQALEDEMVASRPERFKYFFQGDKGTPLVNKLARPPGRRIGPMTAKKGIKIDYSLPTYDRMETPTDQDILNEYRQYGVISPTEFKTGVLLPGEGTLVRMMQGGQGLYGTQFATGGMVGDKSGPAPTGGPMSQGLRSLYNNGRKL